jgi:hypothetical protein
LNALLRILSLPVQLLSKVPGLGPFVKVLSTTVGQKILMAITGLSLCGFLVAHLGGNLKLYAGEQAFNDYAHALHSLGPLLAAGGNRVVCDLCAAYRVGNFNGGNE